MEREFISVSISLLTVSDTRKLDNDKSGDLLQERIQTLWILLHD